MAVRSPPRIRWTTVVPVLAALLLAATWGSKPGAPVLVVAGVVLTAAVLAAVPHAEVVPPCATPGATACRRASTSRSARPWRASG